MQENRENDASGILFTDFAGIAPETESPSESSPQPSPQPPAQPPLVSLEAIASALDIDFEDDDGWTTPAQPPPAVDPTQPPPAAPASPAPAAAAAPAPAPPPPDDELLSLPGGAAIPAPLSPASAPASAPSWADFTRAFQTGSAASPAPTPPAGSPSAASSAAPPPAASAAATAADLFFRAVSAPSVAAGAPAAPRPWAPPGADGMQVAFVDYRPLPGEAGFSFDAAAAVGSGAGLAAFASDDGDDMDILSLLPPMEETADEADFAGTFDDNSASSPEARAGTAGSGGGGGSGRPAPPTGPWRGGRLGVAPARETPYGGLERLDEWFRPPPAGADGTAPAAAGRRDWFVPPDTPGAAPAAASGQPAARTGGRAGASAGAGASTSAGRAAAAQASASAKTDVFSPVPAAGEGQAATFADDVAGPASPPGTAARSGSAGTDSAGGGSGGADSAAAALGAGSGSSPSTDAGGLNADADIDAADDIFSDFDLEQAWTQKAAARAARPATAAYDAPADGAAPDGASAPAGSASGRPPTRYADMFSGIDLEEAWREKQRRRKDTAIRKKEEAARAAFASGADTLVIPASAFDNHDTVIMSARDFDLPDVQPAPEVAAARESVRKKKKKKAPPLAPGLSGGNDAMGFLDDLDSFLDDDVDEDAAAAPEDASAGKKARGSDLPRSLEELEIGDLISPEDEEAVAVAARTGGAVPGEDDYFPAGRVIGGDTPTGEVISGSVPGGGGATVDDIIGQVKPGAAATVDDSVSPPEIGGSLIDTEVPPGTMDEIEAELEAEAAAKAAGEGGETADGEAGEGEADSDVAAEASVPVDPAAALAGFDDMDFSGLDDLLDDETKALLEEDAAEAAGMAEGEGEAGAAGEEGEEAAASGPGGFAGLRQRAAKLAMRALPISWFNKVKRMIAWRENWWFYCDLFAAVVASASLAVIFSYYMWYRE